MISPSGYQRLAAGCSLVCFVDGVVSMFVQQRVVCSSGFALMVWFELSRDVIPFTMPMK